MERCVCVCRGGGGGGGGGEVCVWGGGGGGGGVGVEKVRDELLPFPSVLTVMYWSFMRGQVPPPPHTLPPSPLLECVPSPFTGHLLMTTAPR